MRFKRQRAVAAPRRAPHYIRQNDAYLQNAVRCRCCRRTARINAKRLGYNTQHELVNPTSAAATAQHYQGDKRLGAQWQRLACREARGRPRGP